MMNDEEYIKRIYYKYHEQEKLKDSQEFFNVKIKQRKTNILKLVATFILTMGISFGIVYAATVTYQKIWKEPEEYVFNSEISQEEMSKCISKDEAIKIGKENLDKFGYPNQKIVGGTIEKLFSNNEIYWSLYTDDTVTITLNATTGELKNLSSSTTGRDIANHSTREEAIDVAKELINKYKPENTEYELVSLNGNAENEEDVYIWYAEFYRKYDDLLNQYEKLSIAWIPKTNKLYSFSVENDIFENNPIEISKEEAEKIAKNKHQLIKETEDIINSKVEMRIEKMNSEIYRQEHNIKENRIINNKVNENYTYYLTENRVRRVWVVCIEYNAKIENSITYEGDNLNKRYNTYFVDATTGEIIGGCEYDYFKTEKIRCPMINFENN